MDKTTGGINVTVQKVPIGEAPLSKFNLRCTVESEAVGPFSLYLPENATKKDISRALEQQALHSREHLSVMGMAPAIRAKVLELYDEAAKRVLDLDTPGIKER